MGTIVKAVAGRAGSGGKIGEGAGRRKAFLDYASIFFGIFLGNEYFFFSFFS